LVQVEVGNQKKKKGGRLGKREIKMLNEAN